MTTRRKPAQPKPPTTPAATTQGVQHAVVALDSLTPHPRNYRAHPEAQVARLAASLARFGQVRSIVVQEGADGRYLLVAGHGLTEAARANGYTELRADVIPATWTHAQVEGYLIADNETTRGADDDLTQLAAMLEEQRASGEALESLGYSDEELAAMLDDLANSALAGGDGREVDDPDGGGDDFDTTPDESGPTRCQSGDLWQLGNHRLLCGDSTRREDVARLMAGETAAICFTSPPYNAGDSEALSGNTHTTATKYVLGSDDALSDGAYLDLLYGFTETALAHCEYVFVNIQPLAGNKVAVADYLYRFRDHFADIAIWDKQHAAPAMAQRVMNSQFEMVLVFSPEDHPSRAIGTQQFRGTVPNVYSGPPQRNNEYAAVHAATFPLHFPAWAVTSFTNQGESVYDAFGGTGTTMIACERTGRKCRVMELEPRYCDVILRRWEAETGREATLLERATPAERTTEEPAHVTASAHHQ